MGLVISLILSAAVVAIVVIINFYDCKLKIKRGGVIEIIRYTIGSIGTVSFIVIFMTLLEPGQIKNPEYSKETLLETIELKEIEENIYISYSDSTKEYSYISDNGTQTISKKNCLVLEKECDVKSPQLAHYELSEPENFWFYHLPWKKLDKYIIYVPDREMIGRTN